MAIRISKSPKAKLSHWYWHPSDFASALRMDPITRYIGAWTTIVTDPFTIPSVAKVFHGSISFCVHIQTQFFEFETSCSKFFKHNFFENSFEMQIAWLFWILKAYFLKRNLYYVYFLKTEFLKFFFQSRGLFKNIVLNYNTLEGSLNRSFSIEVFGEFVEEFLELSSWNLNIIFDL